MSVPNSIRHKSRSEIPGKIKSVTSLEPKTSTEPENQEEQHQRQQVARPNIRVVLERKNNKHKNSTGDKLGEEHIRSRQKSLGIGAKDAGSGGFRRRHCPLAIAFKVVDRGDIVDINNARPTEPTEELGEEVYWKTPPGQLAVEAAGEGDGRIEECTRVASNIDTEHDADTPAAINPQQSACIYTRGKIRLGKRSKDNPPPRNRLIAPPAIPARRRRVPSTKQHLRHAPIPKQNHNEHAHELCKRFTQDESDPTPQQRLMLVHLVLLVDGWIGMKPEAGPHRLEFRQLVLEIRRPGVQAGGFV